MENQPDTLFITTGFRFSLYVANLTGGKRGLLEGQAQGAARLPSSDERAHLPPRGQVPGVEEGLDAGE